MALKSTLNPTQGKKPAVTKRLTLSKRSGTVVSCSKILKLAKSHDCKLSKEATVCTASVLEYVIAELHELSQQIARETNSECVTPNHLAAAIKNDDELYALFKQHIICGKSTKN